MTAVDQSFDRAERSRLSRQRLPRRVGRFRRSGKRLIVAVENVVEEQPRDVITVKAVDRRVKLFVRLSGIVRQITVARKARPVGGDLCGGHRRIRRFPFFRRVNLDRVSGEIRFGELQIDRQCDGFSCFERNGSFAFKDRLRKMHRLHGQPDLCVPPGLQRYGQDRFFARKVTGFVHKNITDHGFALTFFRLDPQLSLYPVA